MEFKNIHGSNLLSKFFTNYELKKQVDLIHENKNPHNCRICDKSFSHKCNKNMFKKFMRLEQPHKIVPHWF